MVLPEPGGPHNTRGLCSANQLKSFSVRCVGGKLDQKFRAHDRYQYQYQYLLEYLTKNGEVINIPTTKRLHQFQFN
jgi:hypothetical protein